MTNSEITKLPKSRVQIKFTVTPDEAKPYLEKAVTEISNAQPIKGFRPGKAGYDDVRREFGEMRIWETALEKIVRAYYVKTLLDENLESVGSPEVSVEQIVPNQDIKFTTTVSLMPYATELADYDKQEVIRKCKEIGEAEVEHALQDLCKMRRTEVVADKAATADDMILVDLEISKDGVILEGGITKDHKIYLNEDHYVPGFTEQVAGLKKGDVKDFELEFPKEHYNKHLAGKPATFKVTVKDVYELKMPELNDDFAKELGLESLEKLKELLKKNLQHEEDHRADEAAEIELLDKLAKASRFSEIPDILLNEEVRRMIRELENTATERGMNIDDYLASIKRTIDQLKLDFVPRAIERIQTAIIIKEVAKRENVTVSDQEIEDEQDRLISGIKESDKETRELIASPDYRDYLSIQMKNQKVLKLLKEKGIKS
ncbi:MAG: trigger factor [Patescibacteria group bacterium]